MFYRGVTRSCRGRSWPNLLGGGSGLDRPAHIGAVVAGHIRVCWCRAGSPPPVSAQSSGRGFFHWNAGAAPLCCRKPATKGGKAVGAAADASLIPYVHSVSLCAPRSGFLAPAPPFRPGLFFWQRRRCDGGRGLSLLRRRALNAAVLVLGKCSYVNIPMTRKIYLANPAGGRILSVCHTTSRCDLRSSCSPRAVADWTNWRARPGSARPTSRASRSGNCSSSAWCGCRRLRNRSRQHERRLQSGVDVASDGR